MIVRRFQDSDADTVSAVIATTLLTSNVGDYSEEHMRELIQRMQPKDILRRAEAFHFYVAEDAGAVIGCGAIGAYWDKADESSLFTIFVHPDRQRKGVGRAIVETLERDAYAVRAWRIEIPASITGEPFYRKLGYAHKAGGDKPDEEGLYRLEKRRDRALIGTPWKNGGR